MHYVPFHLTDSEGEYVNPYYLLLKPGMVVPRVPVFNPFTVEADASPKSRQSRLRPLQASSSTKNGRGRNYSVQSVKHKPLSGVAVSSRKR